MTSSKEKDDERQWSDLPELILHAIAVRLRGPADLLTFAGVCQSWRSITYFSSIELFSSLPRPIFSSIESFSSLPRPIFNSSSLSHFNIVPQPFSGALFLYSPRDYNVIIKYHSSVAGASTMLFLGLSNGHFITLDKTTKNIVSAINPFTGLKTIFPKISFNFHYALLTEEDMANPDCRLVLVDKMTSHIFYCRATSRRWYMLDFSPRNITDTISYKGYLYIVRCCDQIYELDFRTTRYHELDVRSPFEGRLVESPDGDLVMLRTGVPFVVCWRVMPAMKEDVSSLKDHYWDRTFEWPAGKSLLFRWQRTDDIGFPILATMGIRKRVVVIDPHTTFWRNYLECSLPCSNGVYVIVDNHGRPTLSDFDIF